MRAEQGDPLAVGLQLEAVLEHEVRTEDRDVADPEDAKNNLGDIQAGCSGGFWERNGDTVLGEDTPHLEVLQHRMANPEWCREEPFLMPGMQESASGICATGEKPDDQASMLELGFFKGIVHFTCKDISQRKQRILLG